MLAVQRSQISQVAGGLQALGIIAYNRGLLRILDREGLRAKGAAVLLGLCTFVANRFRAGGSLGTGLLGVSIVDFLAFGIVATFGSRPELVERRLLALLGPPAVATLLVVGISAFRACPPMLEATKGHAPLYSRVLVELSPD